MRKYAGFFLALVGVCLLSPAQAKVLIDIDLSAQTMHVEGSSGSLRLADLLGARRLCDARRHILAAEPADDPLFEEILSFADAAFDLFRRRLCDPRHLRDGLARPAGLAWLRADFAAERRNSFRNGEGRRRDDPYHRPAAGDALCRAAPASPSLLCRRAARLGSAAVAIAAVGATRQGRNGARAHMAEGKITTAKSSSTRQVKRSSSAGMSGASAGGIG